jgi:hypothetical protein
MRKATYVLTNAIKRNVKVSMASALVGDVYRQPNVLKNNIKSFDRPKLAQQARRRMDRRGPSILACKGFLPFKDLKFAKRVSRKDNKKGA